MNRVTLHSGPHHGHIVASTGDTIRMAVRTGPPQQGTPVIEAVYEVDPGTGRAHWLENVHRGELIATIPI